MMDHDHSNCDVLSKTLCMSSKCKHTQTAGDTPWHSSTVSLFLYVLSGQLCATLMLVQQFGYAAYLNVSCTSI